MTTWADLDAEGWRRARELVNAAMADYRVCASSNATALLSLVSDVLHEAGPDDWDEKFVALAGPAIGRHQARKAKATRAQAAAAKLAATDRAIERAVRELGLPLATRGLAGRVVMVLRSRKRPVLIEERHVRDRLRAMRD